MDAVPATHKDLLSAPVGTLATNGHDGYPQVTAMWFLYDEEGGLQLSLNTSRQKLINLTRDPRCSFFILDPANPYRTLEIRADATISPDDDYSFADKLGAKYGGVDLRSNDRPGETRVKVTLTPVKFNTWG